MDPVAQLAVQNLTAVVVLMFLVWMISVRLKDTSIVDIAWGAAGATIAVLTFLTTDGAFARRVLLTSVAVTWGLRLALHIAARKRGKGEDFRYAAWREEHGERWAKRSLVTVFLFQALLIWVITMPLQVAQVSPEPPGLTILDWIGVLAWIKGFVWQAVGDFQLARFLADPANRRRVLDRGLWRYSRHPNYFGEALMWWGTFLMAAATPWAWVTIFSPLLITYLLTRKSGVPLLEKALVERREGYEEYVRRTNAFFPGLPREG